MLQILFAMTTALLIGRFQPFHLGHLYLISEAAKEADKLIIGIGISENKEENPFSFTKRVKMINDSLKGKLTDYSIFAVPDKEKDEEWIINLEKTVPKFDVVYLSDKNTFGEKWVERCLKEKYMIKKIKQYKNINATEIREKIKDNEDIRSLVPESVFNYLKTEG